VVDSGNPTELGHIHAAQAGDARAFEQLVAPHAGKLRALTCRLVGNPADAADLSQETLVRAFERVTSFRGESSFGTWLLAIATHLCLDHLRARGRWRVDAQPLAKDDCMAGASSLHGDLLATLSDPSFVFDVSEHIAFCFTCVARSLSPEMEIALVLREVFDMSNAEGAAALGLTESVFRHHLASARTQMQVAFEGLCALVNKTGACHQCSELRDLTPEQRRGPAPPPLGIPSDSREARWQRRLAVVQNANLETGRSRALHALLFRWIATNATAAASPLEP
jgi:RNA polymerase sigma-70 factor (ECF subfamily)